MAGLELSPAQRFPVSHCPFSAALDWEHALEAETLQNQNQHPESPMEHLWNLGLLQEREHWSSSSSKSCWGPGEYPCGISSQKHRAKLSLFIPAVVLWVQRAPGGHTWAGVKAGRREKSRESRGEEINYQTLGKDWMASEFLRKFGIWRAEVSPVGSPTSSRSWAGKAFPICKNSQVFFLFPP